MNAYPKNSCITEHGVIFERVIKQKISCDFYSFNEKQEKKHNCTLKNIRPATYAFRYACSCDDLYWKFCDVNDSQAKMRFIAGVK
jgi:hypothetical protein